VRQREGENKGTVLFLTTDPLQLLPQKTEVLMTTWQSIQLSSFMEIVVYFILHTQQEDIKRIGGSMDISYIGFEKHEMIPLSHR